MQICSICFWGLLYVTFCLCCVCDNWVTKAFAVVIHRCRRHPRDILGRFRTVFYRAMQCENCLAQPLRLRMRRGRACELLRTDGTTQNKRFAPLWHVCDTPFFLLHMHVRNQQALCRAHFFIAPPWKSHNNIRIKKLNIHMSFFTHSPYPLSFLTSLRSAPLRSASVLSREGAILRQIRQLITQPCPDISVVPDLSVTVTTKHACFIAEWVNASRKKNENEKKKTIASV